MGIVPDFQNPWGPGGQMHAQTPWGKDAVQHGWGHGNDYFTPKTKDDIRKEALLQLAVLAVVVAAPVLVGALSGGGAAASAAAASSGGGATAGAAASTSGGAAATAAIESAAVGSVLAPAASGAVVATGGTAAAATGGAAAAAGTGSALLAGGLGMAALQVFLQPGGGEMAKAAAKLGESALNDFFHSEVPVGNMQGGLGNFSNAKMIHPAMRLLNQFSENLEKQPTAIARLIQHQRQTRRARPNELAELVWKSLPTTLPWPQTFEQSVGRFEQSNDQSTGDSLPEKKLMQLFTADPKYGRSLSSVNLFDYDDSLDELAKAEYGSAATLEEKLDVIERKYQEIVSTGKNELGWTVAADHLDYFLNGVPGPDGKLAPKQVDPQYLFQFARVREAAKRAIGYIFDGNLAGGQEPGLYYYSKRLAIGQSQTVSTFWQAGVDYPGDWNPVLGNVPNMDYWDGLAYAMGGFTINATHATNLFRIDANAVRFRGVIKFSVEDPYDWHEGLFVGSESGNIIIDDAWAQKLVDAKRAFTFLMVSEMKVNYSGSIVNGKIHEIHFEIVE